MVGAEENQPVAAHGFPVPPIERWKSYSLIFLVTALVASCYLMACQSQIGRFSFPLDDAWIHLQFAKVLGLHWRYAYYPNGDLVAGSTSPLYTFLLAVFFFVFRSPNEFLISYTVGLAAFVAGAVVLYELARTLMPQHWVYPMAVVAFYLTDARLYWAALSGMETTLFIFLMLAALWLAVNGRCRAAGIVAGLTMWARPEGLMFIGLLGLWMAARNWRTAIPYAIRSGALVGGYVALHWLINHGPLPNTYAAKIEYYKIRDVAGFLKEIFHQYTDGVVLKALAVMFVIGLFGACYRSIRSKSLHFELIFPVYLLLHVALYSFYLPYSSQNGRYLMPVIPFFYLTAISGIRLVAEMAANRESSEPHLKLIRVGTAAMIGLLGLVAFNKALEDRQIYVLMCRHIAQRHIVAAEYLAGHTTERDIIATHDIGAIAFYSNRKVIDMVGLVSKKMLGHVLNLKYTKTFILDSGATKLACLQTWFDVANMQPEIVFAPDPLDEALEVYDLTSPEKNARFHFMPLPASGYKDLAAERLAHGDVDGAEDALKRAVSFDPNADKTYLVLGAFYERKQNPVKAKACYLKALELSPDNQAAQAALAKLENHPPESVK